MSKVVIRIRNGKFLEDVECEDFQTRSPSHSRFIADNWDCSVEDNGTIKCTQYFPDSECHITITISKYGYMNIFFVTPNYANKPHLSIFSTLSKCFHSNKAKYKKLLLWRGYILVEPSSLDGVLTLSCYEYHLTIEYLHPFRKVTNSCNVYCTVSSPQTTSIHIDLDGIKFMSLLEDIVHIKSNTL